VPHGRPVGGHSADFRLTSGRGLRTSRARLPSAWAMAWSRSLVACIRLA
jgi:hypothetical protein